MSRDAVQESPLCRTGRLPLVSVVIPCRNEAAMLTRCLDSVLASDYPADRMEIIVADGMSEEPTRDLLRDYAGRDSRIKLIDNPGRVTPKALNLAIQASRGELVQRVDAHSTIAQDYISKAVDRLREDAGVWGVGGRMWTSPGAASIFGTAIATGLSHRFGVGNSAFRTAATRPGAAGGRGEALEADAVFNACWPRRVFEDIGGFDERLERSQDIDFARRIRAAGGRLLLDPSMETWYWAKADFAAFCKQNWTNGVWAILPAAFLGNLPVSLRHLVPLGFVAALLISLATGITGLAMGNVAALWAPVAVFVPYLLANLAASVHATLRSKRDAGTPDDESGWRQPGRTLGLLSRMPLVFASLHLLYGAGSLWGAVLVAKHTVTGAARSSQRSTPWPAAPPAADAGPAQAGQARTTARHVEHEVSHSAAAAAPSTFSSSDSNRLAS